MSNGNEKSRDLGLLAYKQAYKLAYNPENVSINLFQKDQVVDKDAGFFGHFSGKYSFSFYRSGQIDRIGTKPHYKKSINLIALKFFENYDDVITSVPLISLYYGSFQQ